MAMLSLAHLRILRTRLLSPQTQLSFNRASQRRMQPSQLCIHIENQQQQRLFSSTAKARKNKTAKNATTTSNATATSNAATTSNATATPKATTTTTTTTTANDSINIDDPVITLAEKDRYIPRLTAKVPKTKIKGPTVETPKVSKFRVDKNSPKTGRIGRRMEEKRLQKAAAAAARAAAAAAAPPPVKKKWVVKKPTLGTRGNFKKLQRENRELLTGSYRNSRNDKVDSESHTRPTWFDRDNTINSEEADSPMQSTWIDRSIASRKTETESPKRSTWADRDNTDSRKETDSLMRSTWADSNNLSSKMGIESPKQSTWIDRNTAGRKTYTESPKQSAWTSGDNSRNRIDTEPSKQSTWTDRNSTSSKMDAESFRRSVRTLDEKEDSLKFPKADLLSWAAVGSPLLSTLPKTTVVDEFISPLPSRSIDAPPIAPRHLDQDFNDKTLSDIKYLQAQDSTRQVVESSAASQRRLPSQAPPQVDRSVYRTILDWSVHPTVQPDDFNVLSEAQRTMVRIKRLASVKGSLSSSPSSALPSSTTVASSKVFQWPYSSKSDAHSDRVSIRDLNSDLSKRSFKFDPIQERYSERRFWMGNSDIGSNSESNSWNEDLAADTKPRRSRARIGFDSLDELNSERNSWSEDLAADTKPRRSRARTGFDSLDEPTSESNSWNEDLVADTKPRRSRARIGFDSLDEQIPTKASESRFKEPIKELQNIKEEDHVSPFKAIKKVTNNQFLYSPRVVFPAIKSRIRTLCKLYYSEESVMMSRARDPEYEHSEWPLVSDCIRVAKEANVEVIKVSQMQLDRVTPDNKGVILEASVAFRHLALGLGPLSEDNEYQLFLSGDFSPIEFKCTTASPAKSGTKGSSKLLLPSEQSTVAKQPKRHPLWVVIEKSNDPVAMGQLIRTAFYLGVDGLLYKHTKCVKPTMEVALASGGSMEQHKIYRVQNMANFVKMSQKNGWQVIGTHLATGSPKARRIDEWPERGIDKPTILVINEGGVELSNSIAKRCAAFFNIPCLDQTRSARAMGGDVVLGVALSRLVNRDPGPQ